MATNIKVPEGNLYTNGRVIEFDNGEQLLIRDVVEYEPTERDKYHTLTESDELTRLGFKFWRNVIKNPSKYWWVIADVNKIFNPLDMSDRVNEDMTIADILNFKLKL